MVRAWSDDMRRRVLERLAGLEGRDRAKAVGAADAFETLAALEPPARATFGPASVDDAWKDAYREGYLEAFELVERRRRDSGATT